MAFQGPDGKTVSGPCDSPTVSEVLRTLHTFFFTPLRETVLELSLFSIIDDTVLHELQFGAEWGENSEQSYVPREIRWLPRSTH